MARRMKGSERAAFQAAVAMLGQMDVVSWFLSELLPPAAAKRHGQRLRSAARAALADMHRAAAPDDHARGRRRSR